MVSKPRRFPWSFWRASPTISSIPRFRICLRCKQMEEPGLLEMSAADARSRGIAEGDTVRVFNRRGDIHLTAKVNGAVQAGVVCARLAWAKLSPGGQNINVLTSQKLTDLGNSATFYSVLVEVELFKAAAAEPLRPGSWTLSIALPYNCGFPYSQSLR